MKTGRLQQNLVRVAVLTFAVFLPIAAIVFMRPIGGSASAASVSAVATYSRGTLHLRIPYDAPRAGAGQLTLEILDPDDHVLGREQRQVEAHKGRGHWQDAIRLDKPLPLEDLVWQRVRYRFEYDDKQASPIAGVESISQIIRTPVLHIIGQQAYLAGGQAAVRVIATDSQNETSAGSRARKAIRRETHGRESRCLHARRRRELCCRFEGPRVRARRRSSAKDRLLEFVAFDSCLSIRKPARARVRGRQDRYLDVVLWNEMGEPTLRAE
jgi:hypothetical protein